MRIRLLMFGALIAVVGCTASTRDGEDNMESSVAYLNPEGLHRNPVYSQVAVTSGRVRTIYVGGQNSVDAKGEVVGKNDIGAQAAQVAKNLQAALAGAGARAEHVVKWNVYVVQGQPPAPAMEAFHKTLGPLPNPPTITVLYVAGLANPDYLLEVDAVAAVPEK